MSTRSQIGFYESANSPIESEGQVYIYRHSNGYPDTKDGVLASLVPFCKAFNKGRGLNDTMYANARCIQWLTNETNKTLKDDKAPYKWLGYGVDTVIHMDIEYFYFVCPTEIRIYNCVSEDKSKWQVVKTVKLAQLLEVA